MKPEIYLNNLALNICFIVRESTAFCTTTNRLIPFKYINAIYLSNLREPLLHPGDKILMLSG
jgi:hypothetical protein